MRFSTVFGLSIALTGLMPTLAAANKDTGHCPDFLANPTAAAPSHQGEFLFSPHTHHWTHNPAHKPVVLVSLDEALPGNRFCGVAVFSNSFGQPSVYVYAGQQFDALGNNPRVFAKVSAGVLYGYVGPYQNKVPLNYHGFSPAIIPSIGYRLTPHDTVQVQVLGSAGLMFSYGHRF